MLLRGVLYGGRGYPLRPQAAPRARASLRCAPPEALSASPRWGEPRTHISHTSHNSAQNTVVSTVQLNPLCLWTLRGACVHERWAA